MSSQPLSYCTYIAKRGLSAGAKDTDACIRAFLYPYVSTDVIEGSETFSKDICNKIFDPINALAKDALKTISGMVARREKAGEAGPTHCSCKCYK